MCKVNAYIGNTANCRKIKIYSEINKYNTEAKFIIRIWNPQPMLNKIHLKNELQDLPF